MNTDQNRASRTKSKRKYNSKKYDQFLVTVPKGQQEEITKEAEKQGYKSRNEYVVAAIREKMENK